MKEIKTVGVIGLGALGVLYASQFTKAIGKERTLVLADRERTERFRKDGIWFNDELCDFNYTAAEDRQEPVDLLLFCVKYRGLADAIQTCRHLVGPDTILISVLNGIRSEEDLCAAFGPEHVVWCVAESMCARKDGNRAYCYQTGDLAVGVPKGHDSADLKRLTAFWDAIGFAYALPEDILVHQWSKLLCNTGCNQTTMVFGCSYEGIHKFGPARDIMIGAMREVMHVARAEGVPLTEADVTHWVGVVDGFADEAESSMYQDRKFHRKSEAPLFSGTICPLARKHNIPVPLNDWLAAQIAEIEATY